MSPRAQRREGEWRARTKKLARAATPVFNELARGGRARPAPLYTYTRPTRAQELDGRVYWLRNNEIIAPLRRDGGGKSATGGKHG